MLGVDGDKHSSNSTPIIGSVPSNEGGRHTNRSKTWGSALTESLRCRYLSQHGGQLSGVRGSENFQNGKVQDGGIDRCRGCFFLSRLSVRCTTREVFGDFVLVAVEEWSHKYLVLHTAHFFAACLHFFSPDLIEFAPEFNEKNLNSLLT